MKHCLLIFSFIFISVTQASAKNMSDLENLPSLWQGVAGDLVVREPASFKIEKSKLLGRKPGSLENDYEVTAALVFGVRTVPVYRLSLRNPSETPDYKTVEMTIHCDDELVPTIFVAVIFNKKTNTYILKDFINAGEGRRLILNGK